MEKWYLCKKFSVFTVKRLNPYKQIEEDERILEYNGKYALESDMLANTFESFREYNNGMKRDCKCNLIFSIDNCICGSVCNCKSINDIRYCDSCGGVCNCLEDMNFDYSCDCSYIVDDNYCDFQDEDYVKYCKENKDLMLYHFKDAYKLKLLAV